jgi:hypothetical protein
VAVAHREHQCDRVGIEPAPDEAAHLARFAVDPLHAGDREDPRPCACAAIVQERRLPDAGVAVEHEHAAAPFPPPFDEGVEHGAFTLAPDEPLSLIGHDAAFRNPDDPTTPGASRHGDRGSPGMPSTGRSRTLVGMLEVTLTRAEMLRPDGTGALR